MNKEDLIKKSYDVYLKRYENYLKDKGNNKQAIASRKSTIKKFLDYIYKYPDRPEFKNINRYHVEAFINEMEETQSIATVNRYFSFLKKFFLYYKKENENTNNIFDYWIYGKDVAKNFVTLTDNEILELYNKLRNNKHKLKSMREEIIFLILAYTGCSLGEVFDLNLYRKPNELIDDNSFIILSEGKIYFQNNNGDIRQITLPKKLIEKINVYIEYLEDKEGYDFNKYSLLFPSIYGNRKNTKDKFKKIDRSSFQKTIKEIVNNSETLKNKNISIKNIRHTFIKKMIDNKISLEVIGDITGLDVSTLKFYLDTEKLNKEKDNILKSKHPFSQILNEL